MAAIADVVFDRARPAALGRFWAAALKFCLHPASRATVEHEGEANR
jgi:hypothetical protein